jgi:hypothetical protein
MVEAQTLSICTFFYCTVQYDTFLTDVRNVRECEIFDLFDFRDVNFSKASMGRRLGD